MNSRNRFSEDNMKPKSKRPIFFAITAFVLLLGAVLLNDLRESFFPAWSSQYDKGKARGKVNREEGLKMMREGLAQLEKSHDLPEAKAHNWYMCGCWCFDQVGMKDRFAEAKKCFARSLEMTKDPIFNSMSLAKMAECDYYGGAAGGGEEYAEQALTRIRTSPDPGADRLFTVLEDLGLSATAAGHYSRAEVAFNQAFDVAEKDNLYNGAFAVQGLVGMACAQTLQGKRADGDKTFLEAMNRADQALGLGSLTSEISIAQYARALQKAGYPKAAQSLVNKLDNKEFVHELGPFVKAS